MDHDDLRYCECGNMLDGNGCCHRCECEPFHEPRGSRMPAHMASVEWPEPDAEAIKEKEGN